MGVSLKIDRPLFLMIEGILNGFLLFVLPKLQIPDYLLGFIGLCVNLLVAYLIAESPASSSTAAPGTVAAILRLPSRVVNRLRYWARPLFR